VPRRLRITRATSLSWKIVSSRPRPWYYTTVVVRPRKHRKGNRALYFSERQDASSNVSSLATATSGPDIDFNGFG
jgi:hypothetical protein